MIYIDLDGVCSDFVGQALKVCKSKLTNRDITSYPLYTHLKMSKNEFIKRCNVNGFWEEMKELPHFPHMRALVENKGAIFLPSPGSFSGAASGKIRWIKDRFGDDFDRYIITKHKSVVCKPGDVLIDDNPTNCTHWKEAGGKAILFPAYWNENQHLADTPMFIKDIYHEVFL